MMENGTILVTGATGYVGARLVTRLLEKGYRVRATGRSLARLRKRPWANDPCVELLPADVIDAASIAKACEGCAAAYYLVHSMMPGEGKFEEVDREAIHAALGPMNFRFLEADQPPGWIPRETYRYPGDPPWAGGTVYRDTRRICVRATPAEVWEQIEALGGKNGGYAGDWLWSLRGTLDRLVRAF